MQTEPKQIVGQRTKINLSTFEGQNKELLEEVKQQFFNSFSVASGESVKFYCFTFLEDDYERGMVTMECANAKPRYVCATVPEKEEDATKALSTFMVINPHIELKTPPLIGWHNDDFIYGRCTARFEVGETFTFI